MHLSLTFFEQTDWVLITIVVSLSVILTSIPTQLDVNSLIIFLIIGCIVLLFVQLGMFELMSGIGFSSCYCYTILHLI